MKPILEYLFSKKSDLDKIKTFRVDTDVDISKLKSGDVLFLRNGDVGMSVFLDDIGSDSFYPGIRIVKNGSMIHPERLITYEFSGLELSGYYQNGKCKYANRFDIIGVISGACDREIYMKPNKLWKYLMDLINNRHKYI